MRALPICLFIPLIFSGCLQTTSLFDGESLNGWDIREGEEHLWEVKDGFISGGSLMNKVKHNSFIVSEKSYQNFDLSMKVRLIEEKWVCNSGIQVRSVRVPDGHKKPWEMIGYQVDIGPKWWGVLYDESRRNKPLAHAPQLKQFQADVINTNAWNDYRILCEGRRIRTWINGHPAVDYTEKDLSIPQDGYIGIQIHGGGKALIQVKDIHIKELTSDNTLPSWNDEQK